MSRRCWLSLIAIVGGILAVQQAAQAQGRHNNSGQFQSAPQTPPQLAIPPALQNSLDRIGTALEDANKKFEPNGEKQRADDDLRAQQSMASSAGVMLYVGSAEAIITLAGVLLVLATLVYTRRASEAARDAVTKAQETMEQAERHAKQQLRAYVFCFERIVQIAEAGNAIKCWAKFRNSGQTPAYKCAFNIDAFIDSYPTPKKDFSPDWADDGRSVLGPGDVMTFFWVLYPTKKEWEGLNSGSKAVWCQGVANYVDTFGITQRTDICFWINREDMGSGEKEMMLFSTSGNNAT